MGSYHIFTNRKLILTHQISDTETDMQLKWQEQTNLESDVNKLYNQFADVENMNEQQKAAFTASLTKLSNDENKLERAIQLLETHYSEKSQELTKAEEQEKTMIENAIPNYKGAGGNA